MTQSQITVIIPTHNRPDLLLDAVRSVLQQRYQHWELLIVENGPHRKVGSVLARLPADPRIRYRHQSEANPSLARNAGIIAARGAYVAFLDDDDEWMPEKLQRQVALMQQEPQLSLATCLVR